MTSTIRNEAPPHTRSAVLPSTPVSAPVKSPSRAHCPKRRESLTIHELDGEALIFDPRTADTHRLNGTALFIWHRLNGQADVPSIARQLGEQYDVSAEEAGTHVAALVATLGEKGLMDQARFDHGG